MATINADVDSVKRFASKLRRVDPEVYRALQRQVRAAGTLVRDDARARTDSAKAKASLRVSASGNTATVRAGGKTSPLPALLEGDGTAGAWRHPVFGSRRNWVGQARHPYLHPALAARGDQARQMIAAGVLEAVDRVVGGDA